MAGRLCGAVAPGGSVAGRDAAHDAGCEGGPSLRCSGAGCDAGPRCPWEGDVVSGAAAEAGPLRDDIDAEVLAPGTARGGGVDAAVVAGAGPVCRGAGRWVGSGGVWRAVGIDAVGLKVVERESGAGVTRAVGKCVGRYAVLMRVASAACSICGAVADEHPGTVVPGRPRGGISARPSSTARSCSPLCGRWFGRIASIHDIASRKRGDTPGTMRFSIASPSSCTARAVAGAGGTPKHK